MRSQSFDNSKLLWHQSCSNYQSIVGHRDFVENIAQRAIAESFFAVLFGFVRVMNGWARAKWRKNRSTRA